MKNSKKTLDIIMKICTFFSVIIVLSYDSTMSVITFVQLCLSYGLYKILENTKYHIVSPTVSIIYLIVAFIFSDTFETLGIADFFGTLHIVVAIYCLAGGFSSLSNLILLRKKSKNYVPVIAKVTGHINNNESEFDFKACYYEYEYNEKKYNVLYNYFDDEAPNIGDYVDIKVNIDNPEVIYTEPHDKKSSIVTFVLLGVGVISLIMGLILFF